MSSDFQRRKAERVFQLFGITALVELALERLKGLRARGHQQADRFRICRCAGNIFHGGLQPVGVVHYQKQVLLFPREKVALLARQPMAAEVQETNSRRMGLLFQTPGQFQEQPTLALPPRRAEDECAARARIARKLPTGKGRRPVGRRECGDEIVYAQEERSPAKNSCQFNNGWSLHGKSFLAVSGPKNRWTRLMPPSRASRFETSVVR